MNHEIHQYYYLRQSWNVLATAMIVTLLAATFILSQTPIYKATATISTSAATSAATKTAAKMQHDSTELLSIRSAYFLRTVVEDNDLNFDLHSGNKGYVAKGFRLLSSRQDLRKTTNEMKVSELQQNLFANLSKHSQWIEIHFESPDPKFAADIVNLVAQTYLMTTSTTGDGAQINTLADRVDEAENQLLKYLHEEPGAASATVLLNTARSNLKVQEDKLAIVEKFIDDKQILLKPLKTSRDPIQMDSNPVFTGDAGIYSALRERSELVTHHQNLATRYGDHHLTMIAITSEIDQANTKLEIQINNAIKRTENEISSYEITTKKLAEEIAKQNETISLLQARQLEYQSLQLAVESARRRFERPDQEKVDISMFSAAAVPVDPIRPRVKESLSAVFIIAIIMMVILLMVRTKLDQ